ncbi:MAG: hypothetical protein LC114_26070, partial [Bryobacterales bacterium]|nr:hypothetical protein [Bryobacterales bacterium]
MTHSSRARPWRLSRRQWCLGTLGAITFGGAHHKMAGADLPIESGTIIVAAYSQSRIIIAADSKASFRADGFQDEVCKLAYPANKVLYAASGLAGVGEWSAVGEARKAAARIVGDNPYLSESSLNSIAESWARAMAAQIRTLPPRLFARAEAESQTSALFAGLEVLEGAGVDPQ